MHVPRCQKTWRGYCDGDDSLDWQGAAADIFPGRNLGDYKLDASAKEVVIDMN